LGYSKTYVSFIIPYMFTNAESFVEIGLVVAYLMGYADFCRLIQKGAVVNLVISGVTGPILIWM